jgi:hypothetical protein
MSGTRLDDASALAGCFRLFRLQSARHHDGWCGKGLGMSWTWQRLRCRIGQSEVRIACTLRCEKLVMFQGSGAFPAATLLKNCGYLTLRYLEGKEDIWDLLARC